MKTIDYSEFSLRITNRPICDARVKILANSMRELGYIESMPITVSEKMEIIDGQHRFLACKALNIPVPYVVSYINPDVLMQRLNSTSAVWRMDEYIHFHAKKGIDQYVRLKIFLNRSQLGTSNSIIVFTGTVQGWANEIRSGKKLKENSNPDKALKLIFFFKGKLKFWSVSSFVRAVTLMCNSVSDKNLEKIKKNCYSIIECANSTQYSNQFIAIMNKYKR